MIKKFIFFAFLSLFTYSCSSENVLYNCIAGICLNSQSGSYHEIIKKYHAQANLQTMPKAEAERSLCAGLNHTVSVIFLYSGEGQLSTANLGLFGLTKENICHGNLIPKNMRTKIEKDNVVLLLDKDKKYILKNFGNPKHKVDTQARQKLYSNHQFNYGSRRFGVECWIYPKPPEEKTLLNNTFCFNKKGKVKTVWVSEMP